MAKNPSNLWEILPIPRPQPLWHSTASYQPMLNWTPQKQLTWHDAATALPECGWDLGCHFPHQTIRAPSTRQATAPAFSPLLRLSGNLSMTKESQVRTKIQETVCECNRRSVHTKYRITEFIWLHSQTLLCKRRCGVGSKARYRSITLLPYPHKAALTTCQIHLPFWMTVQCSLSWGKVNGCQREQDLWVMHQVETHYLIKWYINTGTR